MRLSDIRDADIEQLHTLSIGVGWPHRAEDWAFLTEVGSGIVALDEIDRVMGSAMWFKQGANLATIGMVITSPRLQTKGTGQWLMEQALKKVEGCNLRLHSTRAAQRLYLSLGFKPEKTVFQCQGVVKADIGSQNAIPNGELRTLGKDDLEDMTALDGNAFGANRPSVMESLANISVGYGLYRDGQLAAFSLCRGFGRGHVVGPVVASNDADAISVVYPHVKAHQGSFLRLDTHAEGGAFANFVVQSGMSVFDTVLTMSRSAMPASLSSPSVEESFCYALVSHTLG